MKKQKRKVILSVILVLILCIFLFLTRKEQDNKFQEELIFFKLFSSGQELLQKDTLLSKNQTTEEKTNKQYHFNISYQNIDFKNINLSDTIHKETLVQEKIAPGTKGAFEILLETDEKINYQIKFESKNKKPQNLIFQIDKNDRKYKSLEDMEAELKGEISKNKRIIIYWEWEYEKNAIENLQDTKDGESIKQYCFTIYGIGK